MLYIITFYVSFFFFASYYVVQFILLLCCCFYGEFTVSVPLKTFYLERATVVSHTACFFINWSFVWIIIKQKKQRGRQPVGELKGLLLVHGGDVSVTLHTELFFLKRNLPATGQRSM